LKRKDAIEREIEGKRLKGGGQVRTSKKSIFQPVKEAGTTLFVINKLSAVKQRGRRNRGGERRNLVTLPSEKVRVQPKERPQTRGREKGKPKVKIRKRDDQKGGVTGHGKGEMLGMKRGTVGDD